MAIKDNGRADGIFFMAHKERSNKDNTSHSQDSAEVYNMDIRKKVVDLSAKGNLKVTPYRMTNAGHIGDKFGKITCNEDIAGNIEIVFKKGRFSIWLSPKGKIFTLIKGGV